MKLSVSAVGCLPTSPVLKAHLPSATETSTTKKEVMLVTMASTGTEGEETFEDKEGL